MTRGVFINNIVIYGGSIKCQASVIFKPVWELFFKTKLSANFYKALIPLKKHLHAIATHEALQLDPEAYLLDYLKMQVVYAFGKHI